MLQWNFKRMCKMRGIPKPYSFFIDLGISHNLASDMANDKIDKIGLRHLEMVCLALNCTPNDLLDWRDNLMSRRGKEVKIDIPDDPALSAIKIGRMADDAAEILSSIPAAKLVQLAKMLKEK